MNKPAAADVLNRIYSQLIIFDGVHQFASLVCNPFRSFGTNEQWITNPLEQNF
jgi:hypothetical protein